MKRLFAIILIVVISMTTMVSALAVDTVGGINFVKTFQHGEQIAGIDEYGGLWGWGYWCVNGTERQYFSEPNRIFEGVKFNDVTMGGLWPITYALDVDGNIYILYRITNTIQESKKAYDGNPKFIAIASTGKVNPYFCALDADNVYMGNYTQIHEI